MLRMMKPEQEAATPATPPRPKPSPSPPPAPPKPKSMPVEIGGPAGPEPTRFGDWERKGRVSDF
ncbi:succinate dehydrogenase assembly factor 4 [Pseudoroseomonas wenyumeiae]